MINWPMTLAVTLQILKVAAFLACVRFPVAYVVRYRGTWHHSREGRWLVFSHGAFALILALGAFVVAYPRSLRWHGWPAVAVAVYALLVANFLWLNVIADKAWQERGGRVVQEIPGGLDDGVAGGGQ